MSQRLPPSSIVAKCRSVAELRNVRVFVLGALELTMPNDRTIHNLLADFARVLGELLNYFQNAESELREYTELRDLSSSLH